MKYIKVSFKVRIGEWPETRLTEDFIKKQIENVGQTVLDAFDETIHDVEIKETDQ